MSFDRIILSTDDNPDYLEFLNLTVMAWRKFFPDKKITIAYVGSNKLVTDHIREKLNADCIVFNDSSNIPSANMAKVSRYLAAAEYPYEVCLINDMDTIPLQRNYCLQYSSWRRPNMLLAIGAERYKGMIHEGKFPASNCMGEGHLFHGLFDDFEMLKTIKVYDFKESLLAPPEVFSDESLLRTLIRMHSPPIVYLDRGFAEDRWIDRGDWKINQEKLTSEFYIEANMPRPFSNNFEKIKPLVEYITGEKATRKIIFR